MIIGIGYNNCCRVKPGIEAGRPVTTGFILSKPSFNGIAQNKKRAALQFLEDLHDALKRILRPLQTINAKRPTVTCEAFLTVVGWV